MCVTCNGWDSGVTVYSSHRDGKDVFEIWSNGGSNKSKANVLIATIIDGELFQMGK